MRFQDSDWHELLGHLKPLGLNLLLCNKCLLRDHGRGLATHLSALDMQVRGMARSYASQAICRAPTAPQHCLCRLAGEIGFETAAVDRFVLRQHVATFAPHHPTVDFRRDESGGIVTKVGFVAKTNTNANAGKDIGTEVDRRVLGHVSLPHMESVVIEDTVGSTTQLLSSGRHRVSARARDPSAACSVAPFPRRLPGEHAVAGLVSDKAARRGCSLRAFHSCPNYWFP